MLESAPVGALRLQDHFTLTTVPLSTSCCPGFQSPHERKNIQATTIKPFVAATSRVVERAEI